MVRYILQARVDEVPMAIHIELPELIEERLRAEVPDLGAAAKEAMLVEMYRQGRISHGGVARTLPLRD
jgi:hypothetical protein